MRGALARAVLAATLAVSVAGCSGLPRTGPVGQGLEVGAPDFAPIHLRFDAPPTGASPSAIVKGFLAASWSGDENHAAGRAYLTPAASDAWNPGDKVTVYTEPAALTVEPDGARVTLRGPVSGEVDASGRYQVPRPGQTSSATFRLTKVAGEWRIAELPKGFGVWLSRFYFDRTYRPLTVTYTDPVDRSLLSDTRWFPLGPGLAAMVAKAQLGQVPAYLKGAVVTGFPPGTDLAMDSVPVVDKVARIELTSAALDATPEQRRSAWAQMLRTMRQLPGVKAVELSVNGGPWQIVGVDGVPASLDDLGFHEPEPLAPAIVLRKGDTLQAVDFTGWLRGGDNQRAVDAVLPKVSPAWTSLAVSGDLDQVAAIGASRTHLFRWRRSGGQGHVHLGTALTEPTIDRRGRTWVAGTDAAGVSRIWWVARETPPTEMPRKLGLRKPWSEGRIVAVKPSPAGRRLAVAVEDTAGRTSVYVAGITVGQGGGPVSVGEPWRVAAGLTRMDDLVWLDPGTLGILGSEDGGQTVPIIQPVGGPSQTLTAVRGAEDIVTSGGPRDMIVVSQDGTVWRRVGGTWQERGRVDEFVVPGV